MLTISVSSRMDGTPILEIKATGVKDKKRLTKLHSDLEGAQVKAIPRKKAGIYNVCGAMSDEKGYFDLRVGILLGGAEAKSGT